MMLSKVHSFPKGKTTFSNIFYIQTKEPWFLSFCFFAESIKGPLSLLSVLPLLRTSSCFFSHFERFEKVEMIRNT